MRIITQEEPSSKKIIVQKFGGSSVANPERLRQVAARVATTVRAGARVVVVVSAMGKTTDELLTLARSISRDPPRRELDMLLSSGERMAMALLAMALSELGLDAISFTGSQSGILTNDRHSGARIIEVRPVRIQDELDRDRIVIVAGFQGMSYKREITTLGRGGSDTTAVALAAALGAEACEIYSDVDGVYSADPRVVPAAHHLPSISYEEMQELSEAGARVLNAQAVQWARRAGIVIHARATFGSDRETRVTGALKESATSGGSSFHATAIAGTAQVVVLRTPQGGSQLLAVLQEEGVTLRHCRIFSAAEIGEPGLSVTFTREDLPDFGRTVAELRHVAPELTVDESQGTVTAVGAGLFGSAGVLERSLARLREQGLLVTTADANALRLCIWLPTAQIPQATRALHDWLCVGHE